MTRQFIIKIFFAVVVTVVGISVVLLAAGPYSAIVIAFALISGGIFAWRRCKEIWQRAVGVGALMGGLVLLTLVTIIGFMIFNGRIVRTIEFQGTPPSPIARIVLDRRDPKQKTRIPDTRLHCTPNPAGLTFTAQIKPHAIASNHPVSETIQLEGQGFAADETLNIFLKGASQRGLYSLAFNEQASADGTFSRLEQVAWDKRQSEWQAFVVHQRGTACSQFMGN